MDLQVAGILSLFLIPTLAFLVILPGTRRLRRVTTSTFLFSMAVGATITGITLVFGTLVEFFRFSFHTLPCMAHRQSADLHHLQGFQQRETPCR